MLQKQVVSLELLKLLDELQSESLLKGHYLAGGTALALQLGHRKSTDIDIFANKKQDNAIILNMLKDRYKNYDILNITENGIQVMIKNIKVYGFGRELTTNHTNHTNSYLVLPENLHVPSFFMEFEG